MERGEEGVKWGKENVCDGEGKHADRCHGEDRRGELLWLEDKYHLFPRKA